MNQLALDLVPDRKRTALAHVARLPLWFRKDFAEYLEGNWHVYLAFEREANRIRRSGREHYSQRTIWEYLRHETALREKDNDLDLKLNDHYVKDCARLYVVLHPEAATFFEFRNGQSAVRAA